MTIIAFMMFSHSFYCTLLGYTSVSQHLDSLHYILEQCLFCWCIQWMARNFVMLLAYHNCSHISLNLASWSWTWFDCLHWMLCEHPDSLQPSFLFWKSLRLYQDLILNITLFWIFYDIHLCRWLICQFFVLLIPKYLNMNPEYLILNKIHQAFQILHSMLSLIFQIYCFCTTF